ncbi:indole-3-glycerol phosphate synthase [Alphaproteobacteria bacterium]|nr:indole-3-glycerol phosphate synthase [Alphaproteobacteria bacterium]
MGNVLERIASDKRAALRDIQAKISFSEIEKRAKAAPPPRGFAKTLSRNVEETGFGLIAEIKKASPSAGLIRPDFDPASLARNYQAGGAACLSILTDAAYFQGKNDDLTVARGACERPALRKDFMVDPWQIAESRALGADCVLLILAILSDAQASEMEQLALDYKMDVLVEVHDEAEFERALLLSSPLLGVNNRNLKTMKTDVSTTHRLARHCPEGRVLVAESGLKSNDDLRALAAIGVHRFLIGETLMRQNDVLAATRALLGRGE